MTSSASSSQLPRILLGALIGAVLGLLMLGVALAAWWLAVARHEPQPIVAPEGFEARLDAAAGGAAFGLMPVYVHDRDGPDSSGAVWLSQITSELEAQGHELRPVPTGDAELTREIERLARRWAEPPRRPLLIWRGPAGLMLCRCDHPRARAQARQLLAASAATSADAVEAPASPFVVAPRRAVEPKGSAYPRLGPPPAKTAAPSAPPVAAPARAASPAPSLPGDPVPRRAEAKASPAPRASSVRPASSRRTDPPEARRDADSLFF
ncbi:hypothetical protein EJ082_12695 [Brevundimonas diminuta]|jgi:hypothetical protein|uniref:Uncharacterized protein n=1 Tax=Brevundimonas diminuta TaxID=293 RepID=A0A410NVC9_BREDI|nr:hypothetical protein [Brevundimonas diminuta]MBD3573821.1 hypothetical protein [Brevundimonas diminuta]QAT13811.1 hypothetical protein EQG53_05240 [Brevundimonas diminuta]QQB88825.1 hypothetical protein I6H83_17190 [Brevundimonas diminuta]GEC01148.1 hypothetical protein BDI01nite_22120 [Brevundimonas diminuta]